NAPRLPLYAATASCSHSTLKRISTASVGIVSTLTTKVGSVALCSILNARAGCFTLLSADNTRPMLMVPPAGRARPTFIVAMILILMVFVECGPTIRPVDFVVNMFRESMSVIGITQERGQDPCKCGYVFHRVASRWPEFWLGSILSHGINLTRSKA